MIPARSRQTTIQCNVISHYARVVIKVQGLGIIPRYFEIPSYFERKTSILTKATA